MGERCRLAALGATFALIVAACAATDPQVVPNSEGPTTTSVDSPTVAPTSPVTFPESLADASFVQVEPPDGPCAAGDNSQIAVFDSTSGERDWSFAIPRPGAASVIDSSSAFISFRWDRGQHPGVVALDLRTRAPLWQRFLANEVEQMTSVGGALVVVTSDDLRAIDPETGNDIWVRDPEFDFRAVALGENAAFTLDSVGVHAIDYQTGAELWELEIERADTVAVSGTTLAVAAGTRLVSVDTEQRTRLFDTNTAARRGAGDIWVFDETIAYDLARGTAPGGGVAVLDRVSGIELWRATAIGEPLWVDGNQLISSTANEEPLPGERFVLVGRDGRSGEELWRTPSAAQAFEGVIGLGQGRVVAIDPHPTITNAQRVRMIDSATGEVVWTTSDSESFDRAVIAAPATATLFASSKRVGPDRGTVTHIAGTAQWTASLPDGIAQPPISVANQTVVISGERSPICVSRSVGEPDEQSAVLGAAVER